MLFLLFLIKLLKIQLFRKIFHKLDFKNNAMSKYKMKEKSNFFQ